MIRVGRFISVALVFLFAACCLAEPQASLTPEQQSWLAKGRRSERAGWIYLHIEGEPRERGFQHGYLLAKEIAEGLRVTRIEWQHNSTMDWPWLVTRAAAMFVPRIDAENSWRASPPAPRPPASTSRATTSSPTTASSS
jgi:hypothetical protein